MILGEHVLTELVNLLWQNFAGAGGHRGAEYNALRSFLLKAGLVPPTLDFIGGYGYRDTNISRTRTWLLDYLGDLNTRRTQGSHFSSGIERLLDALLSTEEVRDRVAPLLDRIFDTVGVAVSWNHEWRRYELVKISDVTTSSQSAHELMYDYLDFHPVVRDSSAALFKDQHYAQAVFEACKALETMVQERLSPVDPSCGTLHGKSLMTWALGNRPPYLRINLMNGLTDETEHEGYRFLFIGAVLAIRNPLAHKAIEHDPYQALEYLSFISLLAKRVDVARVIQNTVA
jgi:uncharacterized protein (TIGR02391 family)